MKSSFWRNLRNNLAVGLIGIGVTTPVFGEQLTRLPSVDQVFDWSEQPLVLGQSCSGATDCGAADDGAECCDNDGDCLGTWRDNTVVWFGADGYKSLGDTGRIGFAPTPFGLQDSFGLVGGFNTGFGLGDSRVRGQVGASYGFYDIKGRTTVAPNPDDSLEQQTYVTLGAYKRSDIVDDDPISWGLVLDQFWGHQWGWEANQIYLSQVRAIGGYALNECNEVGVWGTFHTQTDEAQIDFIGPPTSVRGMNQANAFLRHSWDLGGSTMAYVGAVDRADIASWLFGLLGEAPLNNSTALYGNFTYVAPGSNTGLVGSSEEQWNVSVGLTMYLGGNAKSPTVSGRQGLPLLPVANNGSFLITD